MENKSAIGTATPKNVRSSAWSAPTTVVAIAHEAPARCSKRSEERRVGKECRSRCDWSSDVCSSDLKRDRDRYPEERQVECLVGADNRGGDRPRGPRALQQEIGRASCRERV